MSQIAAPANQRLRITLLRASFICLLPLLVFAAPQSVGQVWFPALQMLGLFLIIAAVLGRFWSILYIGRHKNHNVIRQGPYSLCRHPLYFFSVLGVTGFGLLLGSVLLALVLGTLTLGILYATARREEAYLRRAFGPAYDAYAADTPAILPNPRLFRTEAEITVSIRHLRGNLMDALVFLSFIPLAMLIRSLQDQKVVPTFPIW